MLEADRTLLAKHHHFESVDAAIRQGVDIVPSVTLIREWGGARKVADTERGKEMRYTMQMLERLAEAYRNNELRQRDAGGR